MTSPRSSGSKLPSSRKTPTKSGRPKTAPVKNTLLDESINKVAQAEPFNGKGPEIQRVSEGKYVQIEILILNISSIFNL